MTSRSFYLYDTLVKKTKEVIPADGLNLKIYNCGPTVYSYAHIGNFRSFLTIDLVVRVAKALGWNVVYVNNITDVGHLTEESEEICAEDKMAKALSSCSGEKFINVWDLADHYTSAFLHDWKRLNLLEPTVRPKATQHMREQIHFIEKLLQKGHAYETLKGVYFDITSFKKYGELSGNKEENLKKNTRGTVQDLERKNPFDFALWKKDSAHLMQWYSPWGWGFPGWHLECSAMAKVYLGESFDIHAGGEDLIFPHHECEIAQSESLSEKPLAAHWLHTRFLQVEGEKMSKSKNNFYTVRDLLDGQGIPALALRYALLSVPFNKHLNFTFQTLKDAVTIINRFQECLRLIRSSIESLKQGPDEFKDKLPKLYDECLGALCDNLNTSVALAKAYESTKIILKEGSEMSMASARTAEAILNKINDLLGIIKYHDENIQEQEKNLPSETEIKAKILERNEARKNKDYQWADLIRRELLERGIELKDTTEGTVWSIRSEIVQLNEI